MGKVYSHALRPFRNFNVESRAQRIISKEKPVPAPKHEANLREVENIVRDYPNSMQELLRKHPTLNTNLKDVYVRSYDPMNILRTTPSDDRPLPLNKRSFTQPELGFVEPKRIPIGKVSLRGAMQLISNHQLDPEKWTVMKIAFDYNLPQDVTEKILHYFKVLQIYLPDEKNSNVKFATPLVPKQDCIEEPSKAKLLTDNKYDKKNS